MLRLNYTRVPNAKLTQDVYINIKDDNSVDHDNLEN